MNKLSDLDKILQQENKNILEVLTFLVYELENNGTNDLFMLAKLLNDESLANLINYYNGATIKIPTKEEFKSSSYIAYMFYLIDIKHFSFSEAKDILLKSADIDIQGMEIAIGKRLSALRKKLAIKMMEVIQEVQDGTGKQ